MSFVFICGCYFVLLCRSTLSANVRELARGASSTQSVSHPQYKSLGVLPQVRLAERDRLLLEQHNTRMLHDRLTVRLAPPDVIRQPAEL